MTVILTYFKSAEGGDTIKLFLCVLDKPVNV